MARILLIDDMKGVRRTVCAVLGRAGHEVTEAEDGSAGLAVLRGGRRFDLVITDMLLPKQDGMDVIMFLQGQPGRPKILAISGGGSQVSAAEAFLLARTMADGTLQKPFDNAELVEVVDKLLAGAASPLSCSDTNG
jgi:CheY-like chemotaxis protein